MAFRNPFVRTSRLFSRPLRKRYQHTGPPPTHPPNEPIYVSPDLLRRRSSTLSTILRFSIAGAVIGLPCYWILGLGKTVSIPYYVGRLDSFQTQLTDKQKADLTVKVIEGCVEELIVEIKDSIGVPFRVDPMMGTFAVKVPKIDPTRVIYRLDITRSGFSRSEKTFNPADISSFYVSKDVIPGSKIGEVGYKSLDDVREGYVGIEGMVKVTGPLELGGHMGTVEFDAVINVDTQKIVVVRKNRLRVMGRKLED